MGFELAIPWAWWTCGVSVVCALTLGVRAQMLRPGVLDWESPGPWVWLSMWALSLGYLVVFLDLGLALLLGRGLTKVSGRESLIFTLCAVNSAALLHNLVVGAGRALKAKAAESPAVSTAAGWPADTGRSFAPVNPGVDPWAEDPRGPRPAPRPNGGKHKGDGR